jgi:TolA-binding protein
MSHISNRCAYTIVIANFDRENGQTSRLSFVSLPLECLTIPSSIPAVKRTENKTMSTTESLELEITRLQFKLGEKNKEIARMKKTIQKLQIRESNLIDENHDLQVKLRRLFDTILESAKVGVNQADEALAKIH